MIVSDDILFYVCLYALFHVDPRLGHMPTLSDPATHAARKEGHPETGEVEGSNYRRDREDQRCNRLRPLYVFLLFRFVLYHPNGLKFLLDLDCIKVEIRVREAINCEKYPKDSNHIVKSIDIGWAGSGSDT